VSPLTWAAFVLAGAAGAVVRYLVDAATTERTDGLFPWGTFVINVTGALVLGFLTGLSLFHAFPRTPKVVLGTGFCGAYTTFSTFTFETVRLAEEDALGLALLYALGTLLVGAAAAAAGLIIAAV
jgi:fluoride exporter